MRICLIKCVAYTCVSKVESTTLSVGTYKGWACMMYLRLLACIGSCLCISMRMHRLEALHTLASASINAHQELRMFLNILARILRSACMYMCWRVQTTRRVSKCVFMR
jgi:hypothetical protein